MGRGLLRPAGTVDVNRPHRDRPDPQASEATAPVHPAAPVAVPGLVTGVRPAGPVVRRDVELQDISRYRARFPVRAWVVENTDYTLRDVELGGLAFTEIVGANVLLYEKALRDPAIIPSLNKFLTSSLEAFRGIPIWHRFYRPAVAGTVQPMGSGPPDFTTAKSAYVPFADAKGEARAAAISRRGASNPGQSASWEDVPGFDEDSPTQQVGVIVKATVSRSGGDSVAFFNVGELQIKGPVDCVVETSFQMQDIMPAKFIPMKMRGERGGPPLDDGIHDADL